MKRLFLLVLAAACLCAANAHADGDPASDYLYGQQVFFPFNVNIPKEKQQSFTALLAATNRSGYKIRVALIASTYDLGAVTALWRKPREYARFLDAEIQFVYEHRLLVVMPNGFGFAWPHHSSRREYALLGKIPIESDGVGLVDAAETAVRTLAKASGVTIGATQPLPSPSRRNAHDRAVIVLVAVAVFAIAVLLRLALRHRR
jgi:hypothetical protein